MGDVPDSHTHLEQYSDNHTVLEPIHVIPLEAGPILVDPKYHLHLNPRDPEYEQRIAMPVPDIELDEVKIAPEDEPITKYCKTHWKPDKIQSRKIRVEIDCDICAGGNIGKIYDRERRRIACSCGPPTYSKWIIKWRAWNQEFAHSIHAPQIEELKDVMDLTVVQDPEKNVVFKLDLMKQVRGYLTLLSAIDQCSELAEREFIEFALIRTSRFLELQYANPDEVLVPALDIMAVWSSLLIRNGRYNLMDGLAPFMLDHKELMIVGASGEPIWLGRNQTSLNAEIEKKKSLWSSHFKDSAMSQYSLSIVEIKEEMEKFIAEKNNNKVYRSLIMKGWDVSNYLSPAGTENGTQCSDQKFSKTLEWIRRINFRGTCVQMDTSKDY